MVDGAIKAGKVAQPTVKCTSPPVAHEDGRKQFAEFVKGAPVIVSKKSAGKKEPGDDASVSAQKDVKSQKDQTVKEKPAPLEPVPSVDGQALQRQKSSGDGDSDQDSGVGNDALASISDTTSLVGAGGPNLVYWRCKRCHRGINTFCRQYPNL